MDRAGTACIERIQLRPFITLEGTPRGTRHIVELTDITIDGERLQAKQKGAAAADWLLVAADGTGMLDVRYCARQSTGRSYTPPTPAGSTCPKALAKLPSTPRPCSRPAIRGTPGSTRSRRWPGGPRQVHAPHIRGVRSALAQRAGNGRGVVARPRRPFQCLDGERLDRRPR